MVMLFGACGICLGFGGERGLGESEAVRTSGRELWGLHAELPPLVAAGKQPPGAVCAWHDFCPVRPPLAGHGPPGVQGLPWGWR